LESNNTNIASKIQSLLHHKKAFVFYRKPKSKRVKLVVQKNTQLIIATSFKESGFVFSPFNSTKDSILFLNSQSDTSIYPLPHGNKTTSKSFDVKQDSKLKYLNLLTKTIQYIHEGNADKIVISRKIKKNYSKEFIGTIYENLLQNYPDAFVYIWSHPKIGLWMGATPETLLKTKESSFSTMSLAGTQLYTDKIQWEKKEIEEQKWVTDYIIEQLTPLDSKLDISNIFTKKAGHLAHICSEIKGNISNDFSLKDLVFRLHPTPAICGIPRDFATTFITENEGYNREYYTGFLGEINLNKQTDLYVNLRCMKLIKGEANLYVGGGITKDSIPINEWEETVNKAGIMGQFLLTTNTGSN